MEKVFAVPTDKIRQRFLPGLVAGSEKEILDFMKREGRFYDRTEALENDPKLKQIIPYIIVTHSEKFLVYQRTPKQTEKRLHQKFSIGFGGHINPEDIDGGRNPVVGGRDRELSEELVLPEMPGFSFMGTLNVLYNPIEEFHMGIVYKATLKDPTYALGEPDRFTSCGWMSLQEVAAVYERLEGFSKGIVDGLLGRQVKTA